MTVPIPAALPVPSPNGFDVYMEAAQTVVPADPPVDPINDKTPRTPQQAQALYTPQRRHDWIVSNAAAWKLVERAKTLTCRAPNVRGNAAFPAWAKLRALAQAQIIRAKDAKFREQWDDALGIGLDVLEMARNIERGTVLIGALVSVAIEFIALRSLEDVPAHLDASQAQTAARRLETLLANVQPLSEVFQEEKWNILTVLNRPGLLPGQLGPDFLSLLTSRAKITQQHIDVMDSFITQADKPMGARSAVSPRHRNVASAFDSFRATLFDHTRREANERLFLLRLALRAYRLEQGTYPAQFADLVPNYLHQIPHDPFGSGEPLRYRTSDDSYLAWSIGPDGIDSGGVPIPLLPGKPFAFAEFNSQGDIAVSPDTGAPL